MLTDWTKRGVTQRPIEAHIVRKIVRALKDAGNPVVRVDYDVRGFDGGAVRTEHGVLNEVFNLDEAWLVTESGHQVFLVMGQEWDTITDYHTALEEALAPINDWVNRNA